MEKFVRKVPHTSVSKVSRRQFLSRLAAIGAAGGAVAAGALVAGLEAARPQIIILPDGASSPDSTLEDIRPRIVSRSEWGALPVNHAARNEYGIYRKGSNPYGWYVYRASLQESYQTLVIHHSAFYEADGLATLAEVQRLHREDRGWADVGYHLLVDKDGTIYEGRELSVRGAHTAGYNTGSAGICLLGDFRFEAPAKVQLDATLSLVRWLVELLNPSHLAGHKQFNPATICPGPFLAAQIEALAHAAGLRFGSDGYQAAAGAADACACCSCASHL